MQVRDGQDVQVGNHNTQETYIDTYIAQRIAAASAVPVVVGLRWLPLGDYRLGPQVSHTRGAESVLPSVDAAEAAGRTGLCRVVLDPVSSQRGRVGAATRKQVPGALTRGLGADTRNR